MQPRQPIDLRATLVMVVGTSAPPAEEWDLNPDTLLANTSSMVTIAPALSRGNGAVTRTSASGQGGLSFSLTQPKITSTANGMVAIKTPSTPGLYPFIPGRPAGKPLPGTRTPSDRHQAVPSRVGKNSPS